jgi:hypothetical protein
MNDVMIDKWRKSIQSRKQVGGLSILWDRKLDSLQETPFDRRQGITERRTGNKVSKQETVLSVDS